MNNVFSKARRYRMRMAWSVWFVAAVFVLFQFFLQLSSGVILVEVMKSFQLSPFGGGLLMSSYYYIYVLLQMPAGILMDRYGQRWILSLGAFSVGLGCFLFATAKLLMMALIGRILMGAGASFAFVGCMNLVSVWFPARQFAFMTAIVEMAGMFGAIMGNFGLAAIVHHLGWRHCLNMAAIFSMGLSIALAAIVRDTPVRRQKQKSSIFTATFLKGVVQLLKNPIAWNNGFYSGVMFGVLTVFTALWAIPFLQTTYHLNLWMASMIASTSYAGVAVGGPLLGWLDAKTRLRKTMLIFNGICATICMTIVISITHLALPALMVVLFLLGMCASGYVLTFAIANEIAPPSYRGTSIGFTNMLCVAIAPIAQPLIGFLLTLMDFSLALSVLPLLIAAATILAAFLPSKK